MYVCIYAFILQQDNTQNIKPEGQQGSEALTAAFHTHGVSEESNSTSIGH